MLVHYSSPKGSIVVDGKRVYGFLELRTPVTISWEEYKKNRHDYIQASYTKQILEGMFPGQVFPNILFTYHEMRFLSWEQMCAICKGVGLVTNREKGKRRTRLRKFFREYC